MLGAMGEQSDKSNPSINLYCLEPFAVISTNFAATSPIQRKVLSAALGSGNQMLDMDPETQFIK